jgi:sugar/nucleoside kinase (ribokinase family)
MSGCIVAAGYADVDIIKTIETFPQRHGLVSIKNISYALGGAACNCGLDLAMLAPEITVKPMAIIGNDDHGAYVTSKFDKCANIDQSLMIRGGSTAFTDVLDEADTRVRTFLVYRGANTRFDVDCVDVDRLECDVFHIGYICLLDALDAPDAQYGTKMARLLAKVRAAGILTSVDAITDATGRHRILMPPAMKQADIMCVNEHEAGAGLDMELMLPDGSLNEELMPAALEKFKQSGVKKWAVIHAPGCAWGIDENGDILRVPGAILPDGYIKGTVGAGDAFVSGLLIGAQKGLNMASAMEYGIAAAVTSLSEAGASDGIRPMNEALDLLKTFKRGE